MTTNYTPGPWHYHRHGGANLYADDGTEIGHINQVDNGLLIAAAPDLLAACEAVAATTWSRNTATIIGEQVRAAIAKAKGETK